MPSAPTDTLSWVHLAPLILLSSHVIVTTLNETHPSALPFFLLPFLFSPFSVLRFVCLPMFCFYFFDYFLFFSFFVFSFVFPFPFIASAPPLSCALRFFLKSTCRFLKFIYSFWTFIILLRVLPFLLLSSHPTPCQNQVQPTPIFSHAARQKPARNSGFWRPREPKNGITKRARLHKTILYY